MLLHGFGSSCASTWVETGWTALLEDAGREVVCPDLLGHGRAPKPQDPGAYAGLGQAVLDELPEEPVDGVGFSLGAQVLLGLAAEHPERFRRLVVAGVGSNLFRRDDPEALARAIEGHEADASIADAPWARYMVDAARSSGNDPGALAACLRRPAATPDRLAAVGCPVLVVLGDRDFAGPADPLLDALPDADLVTLPGVDHFATPKAFAFIDAGLGFIDAGV